MIYFAILFASLGLEAGQSQAEGDWVLVEPPGVGVTIEMPVVPAFIEQKLRPVRELDEITVRTRSAVIDRGNTNFTFVYHDEQKMPSGRSRINRVLDGAVTGAITLVNGELVEQEEVFMDRHKGRDFIYKCEVSDAKLQTVHKLKLRSRIILIGRRLFSMNYITLENDYDDDLAERYFDSFKLVKAAKDLPPKPRPGRARQLAEELESELEAQTNSNEEYP